MSSTLWIQKKLNRLRWVTLSAVFLLLLLIPFFHLYQTYKAAHAYDLLSTSQKVVYHSVELMVSPFTSNPVRSLDFVKGNTWAGTWFGIKVADPLALVGRVAAVKNNQWTLLSPLVFAVMLPVLLSIVFGRFFCGWICPATFLYELNDNLGSFLAKRGFPVSNRRLASSIKYGVLLSGIVLSVFFGAGFFAQIYPPAVIGRETYFLIAGGGLSIGILFILLTLLFDLLVARRGFCRYLCPGGALYSLLGYFRVLRIQRAVASCTDCGRCNAVCQFGLDPQHDSFGINCNNCSACIASCPTDALSFHWRMLDVPYQGNGHQGKHFHPVSHTPSRVEGAAPVGRAV